METMTTEEILARANAIGGSTEPAKIKSRSFLDETGRETYYVKNLGSSQLYFGKLSMTIKRGDILDLLEDRDIDTLSKDPDLRKFLASGTKLKRLTKEEYEHEMAIKEDMDRRIAIIQAEQEYKVLNPTVAVKKDTKPIRATVLNKVSMLNDFNNPDINVSKYGMNPVEFARWASTEAFQSNEIDYILSSVEDSEIRAFMFKRKKELAV